MTGRHPVPTSVKKTTSEYFVSFHVTLLRNQNPSFTNHNLFSCSKCQAKNNHHHIKHIKQHKNCDCYRLLRFSPPLSSLICVVLICTRVAWIIHSYTSPQHAVICWACISLTGSCEDSKCFGFPVEFGGGSEGVGGIGGGREGPL